MLTDEEALRKAEGEYMMNGSPEFRAGFTSALAWLRSQGAPVAYRYRDGSDDGKPRWGWAYRTDPLVGAEPLYLAPRPAIPDGWLDRGKAALAECRAADDLWSDDRLLSHLFNAMTTAPEPKSC